MVDLVKFLAQSLVENKEAVEVTIVDEENQKTIYLKVAPDEVGKVIGKQGRIANAIRTLVTAKSGGEDRYYVKIVED